VSNGPRFEVQIREVDIPGPVRAHADLRIFLPDGELLIMGFAVIQKPGQDIFIGFPSNKGRNKYFPVVEAKGETRDRIVGAILDAYESQKSRV
jgi:DNA-binding cell septation regulator SpoVG